MTAGLPSPLPPAEAPRVAVMQPYFLPYLGTFQLARAVDDFVFFDDVAFIKKGYIHRNSLLLDGQAHAFTVPVRQVSQNRPINAHDYTGEWPALLDLLRRAYRQAPQVEATLAWLAPLLADPDRNVARTNARVFRAVAERLGIRPRWWMASELPARTPGLRAQSRIIDLCQQLGGRSYVNAAGGRALYEPADFAAHGLSLRFVHGACAPYAQVKAAAFVPNLSIIDLMMHLSPEEIGRRLDDYTLGV